jgi:glycosyl transferase family 25
MTIPIFVINLKTSPDRRERAQLELACVGLTPRFVEAVDGRKLPPEEISRIVDGAGRLNRAPKPLSATEVGCYLSHLKVMETIVAEDIPQALVLEDDLTSTTELPNVLDALETKELPPYDLVRLGISEPLHKTFTPITDLTPRSALVRHHNVINSNLAYVITKAGAERFLRYARPIRYPADVALNRSWRHGLNILGVRPWPVEPNMAAGTTIGADRFEEAPAPGTVGQQAQRRLRKAYDSLAKRLELWVRMKGDKAWRKSHPARP